MDNTERRSLVNTELAANVTLMSKGVKGQVPLQLTIVERRRYTFVDVGVVPLSQFGQHNLAPNVTSNRTFASCGRRESFNITATNEVPNKERQSTVFVTLFPTVLRIERLPVVVVAFWATLPQRTKY